MFGMIKFKTYKIHKQVTKDMISDSMMEFFHFYIQMEICCKNEYIVRCLKKYLYYSHGWIYPP